MHILILTTVYPPEVRSASQIMFELAESLKNRGHEVTVITSNPSETTDENSKFYEKVYSKKIKDNIRVIRISTLPVHRTKAPAAVRGIGQILNAMAYLVAGLVLKNVDVTLAYSPPIGLGITGVLLQMIKKVPHTFNAQDLVPQYAVDLGILTDRNVIRLAKVIEHFIYRNARFITVHSKGNKDYMINEGVDPDKVHVIPNWVDTELVKPSEKQNEFRKMHKLENKFVVLFAGILGYAQDLDTVVESGVYLKEHKDILLLIVGEGVEKDRLVKKAEKLELPNIKFLPFVSKEKYPEVVAASDACLATLQKHLLCPVVPSKILGYMSAGRPVVAGLPMDGDAPYVIKNAKSGLCVPPGKPEELANAIVEMYHNKDKCNQWGKNGRKYILEYHTRTKCIAHYETLFERALNS